MKKRNLYILSFIMISAVLLCGCNHSTRENAQTNNTETNTVTKEDEDTEANAGKGADSNETGMTFFVEGMEEEVSAVLYEREGFTITIPAEGWKETAPDLWNSTADERVRLWITKMNCNTLHDAASMLLKNKFLKVEEEPYFSKLTESGAEYVKLAIGKDAVWAVCFALPDSTEYEEGYGTRLRTIVETFHAETQAGPFGYMGYTGYLDECSDWNDVSYAYCDFDRDGQADRVFREMQENMEYVHYRLDFGNGEVLDIPKDLFDTETPRFRGVDLTNDGKNEILFYLTAEMSTDLRAFGELVIFQKKNGSYEEMELPFTKSEEGYGQKLQIFYKALQEQEIEISIPKMNYAHSIFINEELWKDFSYKENFTAGQGEWHTVWNYDIADTSEGKNWYARFIYLISGQRTDSKLLWSIKTEK